MLVAGAHRLEAEKKLGRKTIKAEVIKKVDADQALLAEIDENLLGPELTPAERAQHIDARKAVWERLHPETKHGGAPGKAGGGKKAKEAKLDSFAEATAKATGQSKTKVKRDAARGKKVAVLSDIVGTSLDKGTELDALAELPVEEQRDLAERAKGGESVTAIASAKGRRARKASEPVVSAVEETANLNVEATKEARTAYYAADDEPLAAKPLVAPPRAWPAIPPLPNDQLQAVADNLTDYTQAELDELVEDLQRQVKECSAWVETFQDARAAAPPVESEAAKPVEKDEAACAIAIADDAGATKSEEPPRTKKLSAKEEKALAKRINQAASNTGNDWHIEYFKTNDAWVRIEGEETLEHHVKHTSDLDVVDLLELANDFEIDVEEVCRKANAIIKVRKVDKKAPDTKFDVPADLSIPEHMRRTLDAPTKH